MEQEAAVGLPSGTVTLLFTDIEGSTRLLHELGDDYLELLATHDRLLRAAWAEHNGVEVHTEGDAFFVAFADVHDAVGAAAAAQRALAQYPWRAGGVPMVRMGVHLGTPKLYGRDYWGVDVHYAARLCSAANGGQVLLSEPTVAAIDAEVDDLGQHALKDFPSPRRLFHLRVDGRGHGDFPAPRSLRAGRTNLPDQISTLIGRAVEVAAVAELVDSHRLVTLAGPGGVGKSRLAVEVGADLLDGSGDGVWIVELAGLADDTWLTNAVADALGVRLAADVPPLDQVADHLGDVRLLLIIDNCEHLIGASACVTEALLRRCRGLTVLTTSREPLGLTGEVVYRVPSLSLAPEGTDDPEVAIKYDAVRLFVERAVAYRSDFAFGPDNMRDVMAIVRRLDGIPLAIELATPWLGRLSVSEVRTRFDRGFALLSGGQRTALSRQRTVAALIDWSYDRLPAPEQQLLAELSVFAGGFDLAAAEAVCAVTFGDAVVVHLGALIDKSLVQVDDVTGELRYRLLETVRAYAADKLGAMGDAAERARSAHLAHFTVKVGQFDAETDRRQIPQWIAVLKRDRDNLRAAVTRSMAEPDPEVALRLTAAVARFWIEDGHVLDVLEPLNSALARSREATAGRGRALVVRAGLWSYGRNVESCLADTDEALVIAEHIGDNLIALRALHYRVYLLTRSGDLDLAAAAADQAIGLIDATTPQEMVCRVHRAKAAVQMNMGDDPRPSLVTALTAAQRCGEVVEATRVQGQLGFALLTMGEPKAAKDMMTEAVHAARELGMDIDAMSTAMNLGYAILLSGEAEEALRLEIEVLDHAERTSATETELYAMVCITCSRSALGQDAVAATLHAAIDASLAAGGVVLERFEAALKADDVTRLMSALGGARFEECARDGAALSWGKAKELARFAVVRGSDIA